MLLLLLLVLVLVLFALYGGLAINPLLFLVLLLAIFAFAYTPYGGRYRRW